MTRRHALVRAAAALVFALAFAIALVAMAPASLLGAALERATDGRLTLAGASGRVWDGRAVLMARSDAARVRLAWTLSPASLLSARASGSVSVGSADAIAFIARAGRLELGPADVALPAAIVAAAIGPYGGYRIGGTARLRTQRALIDRAGGAARLQIDWMHASSALIDVSPLGSYAALIELTEGSGSVSVRTEAGPLSLDGGGRWSDGGAALTLTARATGERADTLNAWLGTMTPRQADGSYRFAWPQPRAAQRGASS